MTPALRRSPLPASRPAEDLPREAKTTDVNHNASAHVPAKSAAAAAAAAAVPSSSSSSVLSSFLYGMPMSSKPHPDGKLDLKAMSFLSLGKDRAEKTAVKESCAGGELSPPMLTLAPRDRPVISSSASSRGEPSWRARPQSSGRPHLQEAPLLHRARKVR